jgi:hypothetical protein
MAMYYTFTSLRVTEPDTVELLRILRRIEPSLGFRHDFEGPYFVKTTTALNASQITTIQTAINSVREITDQFLAQHEIEAWPIAMQALALTLIDLLNVIRSKLSPVLPPITPEQALTAIRYKAGTLTK